MENLTLSCAVVDRVLLKHTILSAVLKDLIGPEISATTPDTTVQALLSIRDIGVKLIALAHRKAERFPLLPVKTTDEQWAAANTFLWGAFHLENATFDLYHGVKLFADPANFFSEPYKVIGSYLIAKFDVQKAQQMAKEEEMEKTKRARDGKDRGQPAKRAKTATQGNAAPRSAPSGHTIFGLNGVMHHIDRVKGPSGTAVYVLQKDYQRKDAKVYGMNGFTVGDCWPLQIAALRDGVHGQRQAGIHGDSQYGAYSVIVGPLDRDKGNEVIYSAAGGHDTEAKKPDLENQGTKALMASMRTKKPVRVLRINTNWGGSPRCGLRFDGLYEVASSSTETNKKGGKYLMFRLVRLPNQAPIDTQKPSRQQIRHFEAVKLGY